MVLPNRFGKRNAGNASNNAEIRNSRLNPALATGYRPLDTGMTRGQFLRTAGVGAGAVAAAGLGLGTVAHAAGILTYNSVVYPTGFDFPEDFPEKYPYRSDNIAWQWIISENGEWPPDANGMPMWGLPQTYFANIYTADALELMAAIHGGKAEDYWKPIRYDYSPVLKGWAATPLADPYPYATTGNTYAGGGKILLKAKNAGGELKPFNLGTWTPYDTLFCYSLTISGDCELVGEVLPETYDSSSPLAGRNRMAEIANGTAGIGINFYRDDSPDYFGGFARNVTLRNLVLKDALFFAVGIYGGPWMVDRQDILMENVHMLDVWTVPYDFTSAVLSHSFGGSIKMNRCSVINTKPSAGLSDIGVTIAPNAWGESMDTQITGCEFRLPSTPKGSTAVVSAGDPYINPYFLQTAVLSGNSIEADVGFEVCSNYFGTAVISNNPGPGGYFKARAMAFNVSTPESGTSVLIEKNTVVMDSPSSQAYDLPFSAGFFGWGFSYTQLTLFGGIENPDDLGEPHNVVVTNNKMTGTTDVAVFLAETASNNLFKADNIVNLNLEGELTYLFLDDTQNNVVIGNTGGTAYVYPGSDTNVFTGPGFHGLGSEAAQRMVAAVGAARQKAATIKMHPGMAGWHRYFGPKKQV